MSSTHDFAKLENSWTVGYYSFDEYVQRAKDFHGYPAPGILIAGFMVEKAKSYLTRVKLYDAISETAWCLPDAVQILTPCKIGNGWLKIVNMGIYAVSLYDKYTGEGVRVYLDVSKINEWTEIKTWYLKLKSKQEQDSELLFSQIKKAGPTICSTEEIQVQDKYLEKRSKGKIEICPLCGEAYPIKDGGICKACQGNSPYKHRGKLQTRKFSTYPELFLHSVAVEEAVGEKVLHDMTRIEPGNSKGVEFKAGQEITTGDLCRLQQMGRNQVYIDTKKLNDPNWIHEDTVAKYFGRAMSGSGIVPENEPREGKVNLQANQDGVLVVEEESLQHFNMLPGVMCASKHTNIVVSKGTRIAGTRAIPLYLDRNTFDASTAILEEKPFFRINPMRKAKIGIQITGSEIFYGQINDQFEDIITSKVKRLGCEIVQTLVVPDQVRQIKEGVEKLISAGSDLIITTAGLSVDPEDLTRQGLAEAGAKDMLYGAPILPGAMTLLTHIGSVQVFGVPACALFFNTTSFDLILPRLLADMKIDRLELAKMGHGGMCHECRSCTYPKCPFGK